LCSFLLFCSALALVLSGVVLLSYGDVGVNAQRIRESAMTDNSMSFKSADDNVVEVEGVSFETLVSEPIWIIPKNEPNAKLPVTLGVRITNKTPNPIRFSRFDTLYPNLVRQGGQVIQLEGGRDGTLKPKESDFPLVAPRESVTFYLDANLSWQNNKLQLGGSDGFGGLWYFDNLNPDTYQVQFIYQSHKRSVEIDKQGRRILDNIWIGRVATPFVKISLLQA